jgi:hypothetical protein
MAAFVFPSAPVAGQRYPVNPGTSGAAQYEWDSTVGVWNVVSNFVRTNNQSAFNTYDWPNSDGTSGYQLTTDGAGTVSWAAAATPRLALLDDISASFDGVQTAFGLFEGGVTFTPSPSTNILVFLGGVPQTPTSAYSVAGSTITFTAAPPAGTNFYAITTENP